MISSIPTTLLLAVFCLLVWVAPSQAVINGFPADGTEEWAPSVVGITVKIDGVDAYNCSGTLIAPRVVLTALHCLEIDKTRAMSALSVSPDDVVVKFGTDVRDGGYHQVALADIALPPVYGIWLDAIPDLALLLLAEDAPENVAPIPVVSENSFLSVEEIPFLIAGFGISNPDRFENPERDDVGLLHFGLVEIHFGESSITQITIDPDGSAAIAPGDSGGPLLMKGDRGWRVMGVLAGTNMITQDMNVVSAGHWREWIADTIEGWRQGRFTDVAEFFHPTPFTSKTGRAYIIEHCVERYGCVAPAEGSPEWLPKRDFATNSVDPSSPDFPDDGLFFFYPMPFSPMLVQWPSPIGAGTRVRVIQCKEGPEGKKIEEGTVCEIRVNGKKAFVQNGFFLRQLPYSGPKDLDILRRSAAGELQTLVVAGLREPQLLCDRYACTLTAKCEPGPKALMCLSNGYEIIIGPFSGASSRDGWSGTLAVSEPTGMASVYTLCPDCTGPYAPYVGLMGAIDFALHDNFLVLTFNRRRDWTPPVALAPKSQRYSVSRAIFEGLPNGIGPYYVAPYVPFGRLHIYSEPDEHSEILGYLPVGSDQHYLTECAEADNATIWCRLDMPGRTGWVEDGFLLPQKAGDDSYKYRPETYRTRSKSEPVPVFNLPKAYSARDIIDYIPAGATGIQLRSDCHLWFKGDFDPECHMVWTDSAHLIEGVVDVDHLVRE